MMNDEKETNTTRPTIRNKWFNESHDVILLLIGPLPDGKHYVYWFTKRNFPGWLTDDTVSVDELKASRPYKVTLFESIAESIPNDCSMSMFR